VKNRITKGWSGILIEPVRYLFEKLKSFNAGNDRLAFENVAIDTKPGKRTLYRIDETKLKGLPSWADQLGTLLPEIITEKRNFSDRMVEEEVECITFGQLIEKHNIKKVDLLAIDVEGMDYAILQTFPFDQIRPAELIYEVLHLSSSDKTESIALIEKYGYVDIKENAGDIYATLGRIPFYFL
jgi:FkbM family methyltransferase